MKKIIIGCGIVLLLVTGFVVLAFYLAFKPKYKDVSDLDPFKSVVNQKLNTKIKTLILVYPSPSKDENYTYHIEDGTSFGFETELETIVVLPIGTQITIEKVELHTGRVSGTTSAYLFGKVSIEHKEYAFQYTWGDYYSLNEEKPYWVFKKAFWQDKPLDKKYFIEVP